MESGFADLDEAISLRPDDADLYDLRGYAKSGMGRFDGAFDELRTGLELAQEGGDEELVAAIEGLMQGLKE